MLDTNSPIDRHQMFYNLVREVKEFADAYKGSAFFICSHSLASILQDSSYFFITQTTFSPSTKVWKCGVFMNIDLFIDTNIPENDYRLKLILGKGNSRNIIIDSIIDDMNTKVKILDLSNYKTIIK